MEVVIRTLYRLILPVAVGTARLLGPLLPKVSRGLEERRGLVQRWRARGGRAAQCAWFHVASAGELEQALPLVESMRRRMPVAVTFFSPSGMAFAARIGLADKVDFFDYLPIDSAKNARFCLSTLRPRLLVFIRYDLWPNLIWEARSAGVPMVLADAVCGHHRFPTGWIHLALYRSIDRILTVTNEDTELLRQQLPGHRGIITAGDTRFDRVEQRTERTPAPMLIGLDEPVILAGSTHGRDECLLLPAAADVLKGRRGTLVVVPHDPTPQRVVEILAQAGKIGMPAGTLDRARGGERLIVVEKLGILADLYREAHLAYVGGGFGQGVHSVLEPAAAGLPVLLGPRHLKSREAGELVGDGGARVVHGREDLKRMLEELIDRSDKRQAMGRRARAYVEARLGASRRIMAVIDDLLAHAPGQE